METQIFKEDQVVGVVKFRPDNSNLFLSGGSKGHLRLWDIRTGIVVHEFVGGLGPILDVELTGNGKQFISSSDVSGGNVSENSIIVWDISQQVPLSNQSNGTYIAIFSACAPFKLDRYRRYEGHWVSGFPVKRNFSLDGENLISGSSDGYVYLYNYRTSELIWKIKA